MKPESMAGAFGMLMAACIAAFANSTPSLAATDAGYANAPAGVADTLEKGGPPVLCDERCGTRRRGSGMGR